MHAHVKVSVVSINHADEECPPVTDELLGLSVAMFSAQSGHLSKDEFYKGIRYQPLMDVHLYSRFLLPAYQFFNKNRDRNSRAVLRCNAGCNVDDRVFCTLASRKVSINAFKQSDSDESTN